MRAACGKQRARVPIDSGARLGGASLVVMGKAEIRSVPWVVVADLLNDTSSSGFIVRLVRCTHVTRVRLLHSLV